VRRVYAEWEEGKFGDAVALFDADIVFESFMPDSSERVIFHGPEGVEVFMREFLAQWQDYRLIGDEFRKVGSDQVFVAGYQSAAGRQSGVAVEMPMFSIWTFRDGKVVRLIVEFDRKKALEAAGLRE
jgi:ketosteroid isomerase-like protein